LVRSLLDTIRAKNSVDIKKPPILSEVLLR
jgi:hypothetical protein